MPAAELRASVARADFARQRMPCELDVRNVARRVPRGLEGKNREQQINVAADALDSITAPRPELRTDVINDAQAPPPEEAREA